LKYLSYLYAVSTFSTGKTIEILGLSVATLLELKEEAACYSARGKMVHFTQQQPPALVLQWQNKIVKCTGDALIVDVC
jgi:hypothetical protein